MKALFLDRDGVVNRDFGYVHALDNFQWIDNIFELIGYANQHGYLVFIVTNQSGIGRGYFDVSKFEILAQWMLYEFRKNRANVAKIYYCPHLEEDHCTCRKPKIGMLEMAQKDFNVDFNESIIVGDSIRDIQTGKNANLKYNILFNENGKKSYSMEDLKQADVFVNNLLDVREYLI